MKIIFIILILLMTAPLSAESPVGGVNFGMNISSPIEDLTPVYKNVNDLIFNSPSAIMNERLTDKLKEKLYYYKLQGEKILEKREELKHGWSLVFDLVEQREFIRAGKQLDLVFYTINPGEELIAFHPTDTVRSMKDLFRALVNKTAWYIQNEPRNSPILKTMKKNGETLLREKPFLLSGWREVFTIIENGKDLKDAQNQLQLVFHASGSSPVGSTVYSVSVPIK